MSHPRTPGRRQMTLPVPDAALVQASLGDRVGLSHSLEGVAASVAESGQARRAARLMGAAEAIRELIGLPLTQDDDAYHRALAALRAGLDQPTLTKEWAEGKSAPAPID